MLLFDQLGGDLVLDEHHVREYGSGRWGQRVRVWNLGHWRSLASRAAVVRSTKYGRRRGFGPIRCLSGSQVRKLCQKAPNAGAASPWAKVLATSSGFPERTKVTPRIRFIERLPVICGIARIYLSDGAGPIQQDTKRVIYLGRLRLIHRDTKRAIQQFSINRCAYAGAIYAASMAS